MLCFYTVLWHDLPALEDWNLQRDRLSGLAADSNPPGLLLLPASPGGLESAARPPKAVSLQSPIPQGWQGEPKKKALAHTTFFGGMCGVSQSAFLPTPAHCYILHACASPLFGATVFSSGCTQVHELTLITNFEKSEKVLQTKNKKLKLFLGASLVEPCVVQIGRSGYHSPWTCSRCGAAWNLCR